MPDQADDKVNQGAGHGPLPDGYVIERLGLSAMATRFEFVLYGKDRARLRALGEEAFQEIQECEQRWSLFRRDSMLSHINRTAASAWVRLNADDMALFEACISIYRRSGGNFDPSIAPLMSAHGFHGSDAGYDMISEVAAADARDAVSEAGSKTSGHATTNAANAADQPRALEIALERVGFSGLELDRKRRAVHFSKPGMHLDLGAIAKGHALDLAGRVLREGNVEAALLHGGTSTTLAIGSPPELEGWCVAIGESEDAPRAILKDCALAVSAPDGRVIKKAEERLTHVLDPRTGMPATGPQVAAVIAPSALQADAWSTALLVGGSKLKLPKTHDSILAERTPSEDDSEGELRWRAHPSLGPLPQNRPHRFLLSE